MTKQFAIDFEKLPRFKKRTFLPDQVDLRSVEEIKKLYQSLLDRMIQSAADFENWILDRSELEAALDQEGSIIYIRMTCHTDNEEYTNLYQYFIEKIAPEVSVFNDKLNRKLLDVAKKYPLDQKHYGLYLKAVETDVSLFVEKNVPLETQVQLLSQEYQKISGAMMVTFEGKEQTLPQMSLYLENNDRPLREKAWRAMSQRRLQDKLKLEEIFDNMLKLRHAIAQNAGFTNYRDYKFKALHRFDYTPQDCRQYHATVKEAVLPLWKKILEKRKAQMKVDVLRPWDLSVDPLGRAPLRPFQNVDELIQGCRKIFNQLDSHLGRLFDEMSIDGLLDLDSRKGKAPGGYQSSLNEARKPFIFMNAVGLDKDVRTLLHEAGHAFHSLACAELEPADYRHGPMEFNEVASMSMELLADDYLNVFYNPEDKYRSTEAHLEDVVFIVIWVAIVDSFQHWLYENPKHSRDERKAMWLKLNHDFGTHVVSWQGLEEEESYLWHRQLHIFEVPFYYIEYGIAQIGSLQLWLNAQKDQRQALQKYWSALSVGGSLPLPEIYQSAGIKFDFSKNTILPLMVAVEQKL